MNLSFLFKSTSVFFLVLLFVISFSFVEAERGIRIRRKSRSQIVPKISGGYARRYSYGRPIPSYTTKPAPRIRRNFRGRRSGGRTYASGYRNWTPNRNAPGRNNPRVDTIKLGGKSRKERYPVSVENFGANKQKRRIRPYRGGPRPFPSKTINEFDEEYFFPDEAKRGEFKYEFENRYPRPKKKRKNPEEKFPKKPDFKIPYHDEKPFKTKYREPPVSYSSFIQHPHTEAEDVYEDPQELYSEPIIRNKKKRVKKKTNNSRKKNKDEDYNRPFVFEKDEKPETYPPFSTDEYETPKTKRPKKPNFEDYKYEYSKPKPQISNLFNPEDAYDFRGSTKVKDSAFNPTYSQSWSTVVETTARPVQQIQYQTENGFQPQPTYSYSNRDYSTSQKTKTVTNTQQATYYSQPDTYKNVAYNYVSNQVSTTNSNSQTPNHYNYNNVYSNQPTYSQPVQASSFSDITVQKSVPIYDNTETFYNFNNNAYVNGQSSRYYDQDNQKYNNRFGGEKTEADEFIKKHQNLYSNGLSGVPVQGDGYAKDTVKKDYDIGYGDFQFDENPSS